MRDLILLDPDASAVRLQQRDHQLQGDALARSAAAENTECLAGANLKRDVTQNLLRAKRFRHLVERDRRSGVINHSALAGNRKKMSLMRRTSRRMISREEITTLLVAARP